MSTIRPLNCVPPIDESPVHRANCATDRGFNRFPPLGGRPPAGLLLTLIFLGLDYGFAPSLYNGSTVLAIFFLLILVLRKSSLRKLDGLGLWGESDMVERMAAFVCMHAAIALTAHAGSSWLTRAATSYSIPATVLAAGKYAVLLPTLVLIPMRSWSALARRLRPELMATAVVAFTFFPHRLFAMAWPHYSRWLAVAAFRCSQLFVPGLNLHHARHPFIAGPGAETAIVFACSGIRGVYLFDVLFGLFVLWNWEDLNKLRALAAYGIGLTITLLVNVGRIVLLVVLGNTFFPAIDQGDLRVYVGAILFALSCFLLLQVSCSWMVSSSSGTSRS